MRPTFALKTAALAASILFTQQAVASGYSFGTQAVTSQSTANAAAAEASDASVLFYNAAGLAELDSHQISGNLNLVMPTIKYSDAQAKHLRIGSAVQGSTSGKITENVLAPHLYGAYKLNEQITLGLGMYVPFGSSSEYKKDSVLRYNMNQLGIKTIAIEPAVAFKINEQHAIGAGIVAQHTSAELRKFADWGLGLPAVLGGPKPGGLDGYADVKGDDWGFGYHLSYLFKGENDRFRVGVNYRSKVEHNLKGDAQWKVANPTAANMAIYNAAIGKTVAAGGNGYIPKEDASVKIITPESLSVHGMFRANDKINVFGDVTWTRHSRFNKAILNFANEKNIGNGKKANTTTITPNWRDTVKVSLGASYQLDEKWQLRGGMAFDQSPVRSAKDRLVSLPDGNRVWFSAGVKYTPNKNHVFDLAYTHIHIQDTTTQTAAATGTDVDSKGASSAKFKNHANILGLQYTYKF
ncbi:MAG: OmpP1/FadL family transporter [Alysiella sp.]|uniref:OmpP1/FadL family transporter n=1 Tax=Alysiella sp. TaxID=1872483 RepID=UPI0026DB3D59|nr:OmpP1/FadL family transporter [Alysiella sp.]MDO4433735.1 OmpP1/FadL family transporter [Alysiella sp.]